MGETRTIKRYSNRKLYDTQASRYVTLEQIAEMIRAGDDVKIVDNNSKDDLTSVTLAQIIFEEEKRQKSYLSLSAMRNIIQSGGERIEELVSQAGRRVTGVFGRKPADKPGGETAEPAPAGDTAAEKESASALTEFREWIAASQKSIDEWQKKVDERIRHVVEGISPFAAMQKEVAALATRVAELERRLDRVEKGA
jgi:polyhydroxyalkanoate synthesis repressor PhaR